MKKAIHPDYHQQVEIVCACGTTMTTGSTLDGPIRVEICSQCHPFFTGEKKLVDTEGRVEKFERRITEADEKKTERERVAQKKEERRQKSRPTAGMSLREMLEQTRAGK